MIWWFLIIGAVLISFMTTSVMCSGINFEIVQNIDNSSSLVSRMIKIENGKDVSLTCKIIDSESNNYFDNEAVWVKKEKGLRFNKILRSSNLHFTPITIKNQGRYYCASLKHNLYKDIYIAVKPSDEFNLTLERRGKRENGVSNQNNFTYKFENTSRNVPLLATNWSNPFTSKGPPDISRFLKKTVVKYDTKYYGYQTFSEKLREYARVIAPLVAVALIMSTLLYYLMKKFYMCATSRERNSKTEVACQHSACGQYCMLPMKNNENGGFINPTYNRNNNCNQMGQEGDSFANKNDDTFIFLPYLFEA